ncbi:antibiotic biosynthesis monooxygenase [Tumidithrix elongata RA019]|uniref:Antibiotic biosynthesis monooxygenase n=1 Tax=Tumidithrix elongata BACA0141 TaxID=2716417 RepID=A0AAW9PWW0_9CYAN|nr:antibiotic biosynthesis monooxygenase [Tumidithrix elongata RA019]
MSESQNSFSDPSVTVAIARRVKPECIAEFEAFLVGVTTACAQFPGHLGSNIFRPVNADDPEYRIILKFDRLSNLRHWENSAERQQWFAIAEPLTISPPQIQVLSGLETWFTLPGKPTITPPPRYKMVLVTWLTVFPLITIISVTFQQLLVLLPLVLRVAVITAIAVPTMTYLLMPQMTKLFASWLYPPIELPLSTTYTPPAIADGGELSHPLPDLQSTYAEERKVAISLPLNP